ncbi:hypothetical protein PO909_024787 [Leuciscus waleckii]
MSQQAKSCVPPCSRPMSELDTHAYCFVCLGEEHAAAALESGECEHCELFTVQMLCARLGYFQSAPALSSWGSRMDLADEQETGPSLSLACSPDPHVPSRDPKAHPGASSAQAGDDNESLGATDFEQPTSERSSREDKSVEELLEDLHDELSKSWRKPYTSRVFVPSTSTFSTIVGAKARGYAEMPQVEETLASYLSPGSASSLKKPPLPSKPCRITSSLVGKAYQAAGQAGVVLHTMAVLQVYQADLLKNLSVGTTINEEAFSELRRATDLSLRATKQMARAIGRSISALVSTERHLWLNLTGIKDNDRVFLFDSPSISVAQTPVPRLGSHSRGALSSQIANDRRLPVGLGSSLKWSSSSRGMGGSSARLAHQLPRVDGCISGPEIFSPPVERLTCPSAGGQHSGSLLHKSPGRSALTQCEQNSEADFSLGPGKVPVTQGSLYSGVSECGSGFTVQTETTDGGMETPPRSSETDLDQILQSGGGPLCLPTDSAMSPLLLSESPSPPRSGRDGTHMAQDAPVCISSSISAPRSSSQSSPTRVLPLTDSVALAEQSMVLGDNISPRRLAMGDSGEEGPSVSGGGHDIPSQARPVEPSCLAPDGYQLRDTELSPAVIETILSARASSTRKSYANKWGVFERWCVINNADPVNCQIASVLEFLQEKLSTGTCPATLKVYVATRETSSARLFHSWGQTTEASRKNQDPIMGLSNSPRGSG